MQTPEAILFGSGGIDTPCYSKVARAVGTSKSTISRYAQDADKIPLGVLRKIVRCRDLTDKQIVSLVRGW